MADEIKYTAYLGGKADCEQPLKENTLENLLENLKRLFADVLQDAGDEITITVEKE